MSSVTTLTDHTERHERAIRSIRRAPALIAGAATFVVLGLVVLVVGAPWWCLLVAVIVAAACGWAVFVRTVGSIDQTVDHAMGGVEASDESHPRLMNLVEGLSSTAGVDEPQVRVIEDHAANLAAWGTPDDGHILVTSGLLEVLDRIELEAVVAVALMRIRSRDAELGATGAAVLCAPGLKADGDPSGGLLMHQRLNWWLAKLVSQRDFVSDFSGIGLTRYPPALASALEAIEHRGSAVSQLRQASIPLWLANPIGDRALAVPFQAMGTIFEPIAHRSMLMHEL